MSNFSLNNDAIRRYLNRALSGDAERPRPPVTLAGQRPDSVPQPTPPPAPAPPPMTRPTRDRWWDCIASRAAPEPGDEQGPYEYAELVRMNDRFRARLLRAFEHGRESREAAMRDGHDRVRRPTSSDP
jgi:hypothetical protein